MQKIKFMKKERAEFLIIGGGISGLLMAYELFKNGHSFLIIDDTQKNSSSKIAAGMFNPISGKRMTVNWKANELLKSLHDAFIEFERLLGKSYLVEANIHQAFGNSKESNDFTSRLDSQAFNQYVEANNTPKTPLLEEFGSFMVEGSGWVKTKEWIEDYQQYLEKRGEFLAQRFDWNKVFFSDAKWHYGEDSFGNIICCEGHQYDKNPHFNWLPFKLCKGQVLLIKCVGLPKELILKKGVYLVHQYEDIFKVGASYEWNYEDDKPNELGREMLIEKVKQMIALPFEVVHQDAGIRPTTRDRAAILGKHPEQEHLYIFNGLGTKGMLQAPYLAQHFAAHLLEGLQLFPEVDVERFSAFYLNSQS
jgi:glycine/D-amino acid oxidase-like deaminating enzyme